MNIGTKNFVLPWISNGDIATTRTNLAITYKVDFLSSDTQDSM